MTYRLGHERVSAGDALNYVASLPVANPKAAILNACCSGRLTAYGRINLGGDAAAEHGIHPDVWVEFRRLANRSELAWASGEELPAAESQADWGHGEFQVVWHSEEGPAILRISNLWFLRAELELEFLNGKATTTEAVYETASESGMLSLNQRNKGGRPPAPHGQAIATIAFRLAALPPTEQGRCTTDSIIADLKAEYALLGASVNAQSLKKHAEGILRALRERRSAEA